MNKALTGPRPAPSGRARTRTKGDPALAARLRRAMRGEVLFDPFSRGRYATDASHYQVEPLGVVVPACEEDVAVALEVAREEGVPVLPRGAGTSQCGQTVNEALVIDVSKHLDRLVSLDVEGQSAVVQPGIVLDVLNARLKPHDLWFPVDVSTSSRATIGGMAGNNSCGSRSIRYGTMRDNVAAIEAALPDGSRAAFGEIADDVPEDAADPFRSLARALLALGRREADEIQARFPDLMRRVGGYNIDALVPRNRPINLSHLLVGSEGTLAYSERIHIKLSPLPKAKVLGVCHFPTFYQAMDATQHLVTLDPTAVELVDRTMIALSREIAMFRPVVERFVKGDPDALLLVEFAEPDQEENLRRLKRLTEMMADLGFPGGVVEITDDFQKQVWEVRKQGLNIMMSMKGDGKPISFVEDCAVPLKDLAEYTRRLTEVFEKHGTRGTWYAHASVGTLHVRPVINLKQEMGARQMRAIAEEAFEMVREYKGSHSGEHGDGIVRSEFHRDMFGERMVAAFEEVKRLFDPEDRFNPGRIVNPPKMDDPGLFRYKPGYAVRPLKTGLDWSEWGGFAGAVEMCNNNGACRRFDAGVMCPSFRATRDEQHLTRGRANTLRLALSGQLGPDALTSDAMVETLKLCVGCKACKRECPTGVDMARMKTEVLYQRSKTRRPSLRDRLVAWLPRYAPWAARVPWAMNLRDRMPGLAWLSEAALGLARDRTLPHWAAKPFRPAEEAVGPETGPEVVLLVDTFNRYFEPENLDAALAVLTRAGCRVHLVNPGEGARPLCCGRTFLAAGLIDQAREEARRTLDALLPHVRRGAVVVGLEPSCLLTLRDEFLVLLPGEDAKRLASQAMLLEEYLARALDSGEISLPLGPITAKTALLHGHCHQKAFDALSSVQRLLGMVPGLRVETVQSSCCGMAGAFGYQKETAEVSRKMGELSLLPKVRAADEETVIVADGTSCRHQIKDGAAREAVHVAVVLDQATRTA